MVAVWPVIHHRDLKTSLDNAEIAAKAGCCGVFLIEMNGADWKIDAASLEIKQCFPELKVGGNRLSALPAAAIARHLELGLDATWCDNPGASSAGSGAHAESIAARLDRTGHVFFGSVAFKTQGPDPDPGQAARIAADLGWYVTTSGPKTGVAPDIEKLRTMKAAIGERPLAVASGVDPENVQTIAKHVDSILVATGISEDFHRFSAARLAQLMTNLKGVSSDR